MANEMLVKTLNSILSFQIKLFKEMKALKRNWNESLKMQRQTNKQKFVEKIIPGMNAAVDPHVQDTVPLEKN